MELYVISMGKFPEAVRLTLEAAQAAVTGRMAGFGPEVDQDFVAGEVPGVWRHRYRAPSTGRMGFSVWRITRVGDVELP